MKKQAFNPYFYAVSKYPDKGFEFKGTIISNADIYLNGRDETNAVNYYGNNHGSIVEINEKWYVFYHRHTNCGLNGSVAGFKYFAPFAVIKLEDADIWSSFTASVDLSNITTALYFKYVGSGSYDFTSFELQ